MVRRILLLNIREKPSSYLSCFLNKLGMKSSPLLLSSFPMPLKKFSQEEDNLLGEWSYLNRTRQISAYPVIGHPRKVSPSKLENSSRFRLMKKEVGMIPALVEAEKNIKTVTVNK